MTRKRKISRNFYKRGVIWWIRYSVKGQQVRESSESENREDADRLLKKRLGDVVTGKFAGLNLERIKMSELLADVEREYCENARGSLPQLISRLKRLRAAFGKMRAVDFGTDDVRRYRSRRLREGAARATINRELEIVKRAWTLALQCDPPKVTRLFHFPMFEEDNVRIGFLEDEQYAALHAELPAYLKPLLVVAYHVPCRLGELRNLFFNQLDFKANEIVLNPGETKNREGRRMPMFGPIRETLLMQKAIRDAKYPDCPYVFFSKTGHQIVYIRKSWRSACKRAGLSEDTLFHDLRRSAARNMRRAGVPENTIMKIAGWKTPSMFRRYDIQDGKDIQRAGQTMEQWIAAKKAASAADSNASELQASKSKQVN